MFYNNIIRVAYESAGKRKDEDAYATSAFSAFGLKHTLNIGDKSYLKTTIGTSSAQSTYEAFRYFDFQTPAENRLKFTETDNTENRFTFSTLSVSVNFNLFSLGVWKSK